MSIALVSSTKCLRMACELSVAMRAAFTEESVGAALINLAIPKGRPSMLVLLSD